MDGASQRPRNKVGLTIDRLPQLLPQFVELNDDLCGGMKERAASEALYTCQQIAPFIAGIADGPFSVRERWVNPKTGVQTNTGWRDWLWVMSGIADDDPTLEAQCQQLFDEVSEQAGGDTSQNGEQWRATAGRKARRVAAGQQITTVATLVQLATELGWTGYASPASSLLAGVTAVGVTTAGKSAVLGGTTAHEAEALKVAKSRLHSAFVNAQKAGGRRVRSSLVQIALSIPDAGVRAKIMFALAAFLLKAGHSESEIVGAVIACGRPQAEGISALKWTRKKTITTMGGTP